MVSDFLNFNRRKTLELKALWDEITVRQAVFWPKHPVRLSEISSFFTADVNPYFSQHIKKLDLIRLNSGIKFLHGRVL